MKSLSLCVVGSGEEDRKKVCSVLGKKGTVSDISFYNFREDGVILTTIESSSFPKKLSSLFQSIALAEFAVLAVSKDSLDSGAGECILALELFGKKKGFIVTDYEVREQVEKIAFSSKVLCGYEFFYFDELDSLKTRVLELQPDHRNPEDGFLMVGDHFFDVKGIGTVFLGMARSGRVSKHDKLFVSPLGKELIVRSIQMQGKDVDEAVSPARLGLAVRGVSVDDMKRGFFVADKEVESADSAKISFSKSAFYKKEFVFPKKVMAAVDCQFTDAEMESLKEGVASVVFSKKVAFSKGQLVVLCDLDSNVRIIGHGNVLQQE